AVHARIGDGHDQPALDQALDVDLVAHQLRRRTDLAGELDLAAAQRTATAGQFLPGEEEADQLPHRVQAQAAGHHRIAAEVALEEPQVRADVEFGRDPAWAVRATFVVDVGDAVEHQHRRQRQAAAAGT